jgi:ATP-dependent DNA helicase PIF1
MSQEEALTILKTGANVFLTGEPGSGKTHTINAYVSYLRTHNIQPSICASTGIAATHIRGMTIHSWSGIGIKERLSAYDLDKIAANEKVAKRIMHARLLIIDEVSMLSANVFEMVEAVCRTVRRTSRPFGGLQVVLVGDFFQLPPVVKQRALQKEAETEEILFEEGEKPLAPFAYTSSAWRALNPIVCYLGEQHRQEDKEFLAVLSAIRAGTHGEKETTHIKTRMIDGKKVPQGSVRLFPHNADVDRINDEELKKIDGLERSFTMRATGSPAGIESLKRGCLSPEYLLLKVGAHVMFTKNSPMGSFVNGTLGKITSFAPTGAPIVKTHGGKHIVAEPMDWTLEEDGKIKAKIIQVPLRLAWAITVHKSQGMSLDSAVMDLSQAFEYGQGYVALSRVRSLDGLYLLGLNARALEVHPEALQKDAEFRAQSESAEQIFDTMPIPELKEMHTRFLKAAGGIE